MAWTTRIFLGGLGALCIAGAASACERQAPCGDRYGPAPVHAPGPAADPGDAAYFDPYGPRYAAAPCACGEVSLPSSFFAGGGGVGPIPSGEVWGGGYVVIADGGARSGARAWASASAYASTHVSVRISGGGHRGGCCRR